MAGTIRFGCGHSVEAGLSDPVRGPEALCPLCRPATDAKSEGALARLEAAIARAADHAPSSPALLQIAAAFEALKLWCTTADGTDQASREMNFHAAEMMEKCFPDRPVVVVCGETAGARTMMDLRRGLDAVLARLEYGAAKHPGEPWKAQELVDHAQAVIGHSLALAESRPPLGQDAIDALAADPDITGYTIGGRFVSRDELIAEGARREVAVRKHLAAIACRALMALTVEATVMDEKQEPPCR